MARVGEADTTSYLLGRGIAYFGDELDSDGRPKAYRDLGNAEAVVVTVETEELEHFSNRAGLKVLDANVVLQQQIAIALTLTQLDKDNVGLFMAGDVVEVSQTSTPVVGTANLISSTPAGGKWYDLFQTASPAEYPEVGGVRAYRLTGFILAGSGGTPVYVLGTDYEVDLEQGRVFLIHADDSGTVPDATNLDVDFTYATLTIDEIQGLKKSTVKGALKFISINAQNSSKEREYQFHDVTLRAEGDLALLGDEFATLQLNGKAKANAAVDPDSPTCTVREIQ